MYIVRSVPFRYRVGLLWGRSLVLSIRLPQGVGLGTREDAVMGFGFSSICLLPGTFSVPGGGGGRHVCPRLATIFAGARQVDISALASHSVFADFLLFFRSQDCLEGRGKLARL